MSTSFVSFGPGDDEPIGYATTAAADAGPVIWDVEISVPAIRMVLVNRSAEWVTPPTSVDPAYYAEGQLAVFLAGADPQYPAVDELPPGTAVQCRVLSHGSELARVTRTTPEQEASSR